MINVRKSSERGHADHGWLNSYHTFSFANYQDPNFMGFRSLRVINEDWVIPGAGFGTHGHKDMEIITYVLDGAVEHKDSIGNGSIIRPGEIQKMSAGTGILHSEYNPCETEPVHLLQIWIIPDKKGIQPSYEQQKLNLDELDGKLKLIASPEGENDAVSLQQDVKLYAGMLQEGDRLSYNLPENRHAWLQVARGKVSLNGTSLDAGDGVAISDETEINLIAENNAEVLLFDLN
ncbi:quercetin 2,3-dioxygenase [Aphanothece hegewaldii CCALA 016]|uniref:Quercetin 2,3-dioxygenase n=1 Tax=Aphanothece hegewaldii CCALA 016 TaxID=2107694 RepID=A0A2T1LV56_9CHRO|nr:pirin family protein [Aphanothece hegewaldii]PSF35559.1 quercetin 2,3-dioxygenase [Aphanothece hegewaldii CCALA 016]